MSRNRAEFFANPAGQVGRFVIDENAAILHRRRALNVCSGLDEKRVVMLRGHVRPKIPRRNADLFGDFVDAVNRPAFVAAGDDQRLIHARQGIGDGGDDERFPFARNGSGVELARFDQAVNQRAFTQSAGEENRLSRWRAVGDQNRLDIGDALHVGLQIPRRAQHARPVRRIEADRRGVLVLHQREISRPGIFRDNVSLQTEAGRGIDRKNERRSGKNESRDMAFPFRCWIANHVFHFTKL